MVTNPDPNSRMGIFGTPPLAAGVLIGTTLLGVVVILGAFLSQRGRLHLYKRSVVVSFPAWFAGLGGFTRAHEWLSMLLIVDALHAIAGMVVGIGLAVHPHGPPAPYDYIFKLWFLSRWFLQVLHLQCALGSVHYLTQTQPRPASKQRLYALSLILFFILMFLLYVFINIYAAFGLVGFIFGFSFSIFARFNKPARSPSAAKIKSQIVAVSAFTFSVNFLPCFILLCLVGVSNVTWGSEDRFAEIFAYVLLFTNLQLFADGLLSFIILKLPAEDEEQQQQQQHTSGIS